jgi:methylmalonyl-CoA mutase cobalamin-binding subunit
VSGVYSVHLHLGGPVGDDAVVHGLIADSPGQAIAMAIAEVAESIEVCGIQQDADGHLVDVPGIVEES